MAPVAVLDPEVPVLVPQLAQNTPNPVRSSTRIAFTVATPGRVDLTVFDTSGRSVARLMDEHRPAGQYEVAWNGRDNAGRRVAAGVYHYVLRTPEQTLRRKMVLLN
jgi:flagellar hook assembly protein FlgD